MNPQGNHEEELRRREKELQERELAIRMRELEAELHQEPPLYKPVKHRESRGATLTKVINIAKFVGIVVAVVVAFRIASTLAGLVMILAIAWVAYKIFMEDRARK